MAGHESAARARGGANQVLAGDLVQPLYLTLDGRAIAPLPLIIAAELERRQWNVARAVRGCQV